MGGGSNYWGGDHVMWGGANEQAVENRHPYYCRHVQTIQWQTAGSHIALTKRRFYD